MSLFLHLFIVTVLKKMMAMTNWAILVVPT